MLKKVQNIFRRLVDERPYLCNILFFLVFPFVNTKKYDEWIDKLHVKGSWKRFMIKRKLFVCRESKWFPVIQSIKYNLIGKSWDEIDDFLSGMYRVRHLIQKYAEEYSKPNHPPIHEDKYLFWQTFRDYSQREAIKITSDDDFEKFSNFCIGKEYVIVKPLKAGRGEGIEKIDVQNTNLKVLFIKLLKSFNGEWIVEEVLKEVRELAEFHPASVNTIRLVTCIKNGQRKILWSLIRMGKNGSVVDNSTAGGITAQINPETGQIITNGQTKYDLEEYVVHPDSGKKIKGFIIPRWKEMVDIAFELHHRVPWYAMLGWDFVLTEKGWEVLEANEWPGIMPVQFFNQKGLKPMLREVGILED